MGSNIFKYYIICIFLYIFLGSVLVMIKKMQHWSQVIREEKGSSSALKVMMHRIKTSKNQLILLLILGGSAGRKSEDVTFMFYFNWTQSTSDLKVFIRWVWMDEWTWSSYHGKNWPLLSFCISFRGYKLTLFAVLDMTFSSYPISPKHKYICTNCSF